MRADTAAVLQCSHILETSSLVCQGVPKLAWTEIVRYNCTGLTRRRGTQIGPPSEKLPPGSHSHGR